MKIHVAVLYGGRSTEHEVSCRSASFVLKHLDPAKFNIHPIGIDEEGVWWPQDYNSIIGGLNQTTPIQRSPNRDLKLSDGMDPFSGSLAALCGIKDSDARVIMHEQFVVFPVLHGAFGEDGTMQGMLELADVAFVGPDTIGSSIGMDKVVSKRLAKEAGIPVVPWVDFRECNWIKERQFIIERCLERLGLPLFVKPARLGSSVGVTKVKASADLEAAIDNALRYDDKVLVERGLNVREIECAVLGGYEPRVSVAGEIVPHAEFYSYDAKYVDSNGASVIVPAQLTPDQLTQVHKLTRDTFAALELYGMARIDLFLEKNSGNFYFNEVNTIPGFTQISQYPMLWKASGLSEKALIEALVESAIVRQNAKRKLVRSW